MLSLTRRASCRQTAKHGTEIVTRRFAFDHTTCSPGCLCLSAFHRVCLHLLLCIIPCLPSGTIIQSGQVITLYCCAGRSWPVVRTHCSRGYVLPICIIEFATWVHTAQKQRGHRLCVVCVCVCVRVCAVSECRWQL